MDNGFAKILPVLVNVDVDILCKSVEVNPHRTVLVESACIGEVVGGLYQLGSQFVGVLPVVRKFLFKLCPFFLILFYKITFAHPKAMIYKKTGFIFKNAEFFYHSNLLKIVKSMQYVEINTSQNVKIEYQLASVGQRIFAFIIDSIILLMGYGIIALAFSTDSMDEESLSYFIFIIIIIGWLWFYTLASEILGNGQTLGKKAMGIKVVKLNGDEMEFYDYFSRWSVRLFDIYFSVGTLAMLLIAGNKNGQRLGDIIAGTTVIRKNGHASFRLDDILKLNNKRKEDYEFEYPNARQLNESDVILIKNALYRYKKYQNTAHHEVIGLLTDKIMTTLGLSLVFYNHEQRIRFLNKVVSEYIILTR